MRFPLAHLVDTTRPLEGPGRWGRALLFGTIAAAGVVAADLVPTSHRYALPLALALIGLIIIATGLPWDRWGRCLQALPALGYLLVLMVLDFASGPENAPVFVAALPVIWLALFHTRWLLLVGLGGLGLVLFAPPLLAPDVYPTRPWASLGTAFALAVLLGIALQELVGRSRALTEALGQARCDRDIRDAYLGTVGALVIVLDSEGRVTLFNPHSESVTGYQAANVRGEHTRRLFPSAGRFHEHLEEVFAGGGPARFEDDILTASGQRRRIAWALTGLATPEGRLWSAIAAGIDVTEQREAQRLFAQVLSATTDQMIFATDTQGQFTLVNSGGEHLLGYRADELVGVANVKVMHRADELAAHARKYGMSSFEEVLAFAADRKEPSVSEEWHLIRKDGSEVPVSMTVNILRDEDGTQLGYVGVVRDISGERAAQAAMAAALEREKAAAEHARELDRAKGNFVAMVSHDLRTPLTSIVGNLELLLETETGVQSSMHRRLLEAVDRNAQRLDSLVSELLTLSGVESGKLKLSRQVVSLGQVVEGALEALAGRRTPDVVVTVDLPDEPLLVNGDPGQLERVVINIVGNALKFTPPGGTVRIQATGDDPARAELRVSDTGVGIPETELPHIFDRFYRSSRSREGQIPGTGLGLAITKSIVERHGGEIGAFSTPGDGATFVIGLPRLDPAQAEVSEPEPA